MTTLGKLSRSLGTLALLCMGTALAAGAVVRAPEIDAASGLNAIALLSGALLVIRGRKR